MILILNELQYSLYTSQLNAECTGPLVVDQNKTNSQQCLQLSRALRLDQIQNRGVFRFQYEILKVNRLHKKKIQNPYVQKARKWRSNLKSNNTILEISLQ